MILARQRGLHVCSSPSYGVLMSQNIVRGHSQSTSAIVEMLAMLR
jgi:hypothetical protein